MPISAPKLHVDDVSMSFATPNGAFQALAPITLSIATGRFVSLIGPSGCGKSTIFNIIAGLLEPTGGRVLIEGADATGTIGRVGYMLQKDLLLPWRTVLDNAILGMEIQGIPLRQARERALPLLQRYGLSGFEYLYPSSLSGGMRQRAALLRTLLFDTDLILLDEPFGALEGAGSIRAARRLPVQKDWPIWALIATQIGILIGAIAFWEIGARAGWIDAFFWSQPSAIFGTLTIFFTTGDAWTDIGFTFRSTIFGFLLGTTAGSLFGLSFWWSRNYAAIVQPYIICFESIPKLALAPLIVLVFGLGLASKVALATALTLVVSTLTTYAGVK